MSGRRANGEGTIYRRKDGRYEGAAYFRTTSGTRKRIRVYGKTREAVHASLTEAMTKAQQGTPLPIVLGGWVIIWIIGWRMWCDQVSALLRTLSVK
ncbi:MAG: hypothetical protein ACRDYA_13415 [Egibacteraceae bacterium]